MGNFCKTDSIKSKLGTIRIHVALGGWSTFIKEGHKCRGRLIGTMLVNMSGDAAITRCAVKRRLLLVLSGGRREGKCVDRLWPQSVYRKSSRIV